MSPELAFKQTIKKDKLISIELASKQTIKKKISIELAFKQAIKKKIADLAKAKLN